MEVNYSAWDPLSSYSRSDYYISRTDGWMRRWVEEWKGGWNAGGLHQHRKYHLYVGSASSSSKQFLLLGSNIKCTFAVICGCHNKDLPADERFQ